VRLTSLASTPSMLQEADPSAAPRLLQSLIIWGGGAPDVQVSLPASRVKGRPLPLWRSEG
jgi:hypothetical protein